MQGRFNICKSINVIFHINRLKDKSHDHLVKALDKNQHPFMIKCHAGASVGRSMFQDNKDYLQQTCSKIMLNRGNLKEFPTRRPEARQGQSILSSSIKIVLEV